MMYNSTMNIKNGYDFTISVKTYLNDISCKPIKYLALHSGKYNYHKVKEIFVKYINIYILDYV